MAREAGARGGIRVAIAVSEFNFDVTWLMLERAKEEVSFLGATLGPVVKTPGVLRTGPSSAPRKAISSFARSSMSSVTSKLNSLAAIAIRIPPFAVRAGAILVASRSRA